MILLLIFEFFKLQSILCPTKNTELNKFSLFIKKKVKNIFVKFAQLHLGSLSFERHQHVHLSSKLTKKTINTELMENYFNNGGGGGVKDVAGIVNVVVDTAIDS